MNRLIILGFALLLFTAFAGCKESSTVIGTVTGGGKTVEGGNIIFKPMDSDVKPAAGAIQKDGSFELRTAGDEGLKPGSYEVLFTAPLPVEDGQTLGPPSSWRSWKAPSEPVTVEPGENDLKIELTKG